jgi:hypothetical protein
MLIASFDRELAMQKIETVSALVRLNPGTHDFYNATGWRPQLEGTGDSIAMMRSAKNLYNQNQTLVSHSG